MANQFPSYDQSNNAPYDRNNDQGAQSTEIDYGDIPDNMNEQDMRAYLALESKLVMPNQKKRDSFEQQWNDGRSKYDINSNSNTNNKQKTDNTNSNIGFVPPPPQQMNFAFQKQSKPPHQAAYKQHNNSNNNGYKSQNSVSNSHSPQQQRHRNDTNTTTASSVYPDSSYHDNVIDRMSTVTIVSKGKHRREHSFKKQQIPQTNNNVNLPPLSQSKPNKQVVQFPHKTYNNQQPQIEFECNKHNNNTNNNNKQPTSALTAQIAPQKHHLANQYSGQQSGVIQSRNPQGLLVVKQMPYSKKTHACLHIYVEIKPEHIEHIIVYFKRIFSVQQFVDLLKNETNNAAFINAELEIFCADEDGDLDDDFPAPEKNAIIANFGIKNFYIKLINELTDEQRDEIRRSTIAHKSQLLTTEQIDKMHDINDSDTDTDDDDDDEYDSDDGGCNCIIL